MRKLFMVAIVALFLPIVALADCYPVVVYYYPPCPQSVCYHYTVVNSPDYYTNAAHSGGKLYYRNGSGRSWAERSIFGD